MSLSGGSSREEELARMLLWFKAQLPPHDVSEWFIESRPIGVPTVIEDSQTEVTHHRSWADTGDSHRVTGYGRCARCRRRFPINAVTERQEGISRTVETMRKSVTGDADRAGPCWGDVPALPTWSDYAAATLDVSS